MHAAGVVALAYPEVLYQGFGNVNAILEARGSDYAPLLLLQIVAAKIVTTAVCQRSGLVGGIYAPSIFLGAQPPPLQAYTQALQSGTGQFDKHVPGDVVSVHISAAAIILWSVSAYIHLASTWLCYPSHYPWQLSHGLIQLGSVALWASTRQGEAWGLDLVKVFTAVCFLAGAALGSAFGGIAELVGTPLGLQVTAPQAYALVGVAGMLAALCQVPCSTPHAITPLS